MDSRICKRPTRKETEDDILRLQEEFSKSTSFEPAATVIKDSETGKHSKANQQICHSISSAPLLSEVREKNVDITHFEFHFPKTVPKPVQNENSTQDQCSLIESSSSVSSSDKYATAEQREDLESLKAEVNEENLRRMSNMTDEEICNARSELAEKLDSKLIEFLKRRGQRSAPTIQSAREAKPAQSNSSRALEEFPIKPTSQWPHMDKPEPEKLAWMTSLPQTMSQKDLYTARFDFKGNLVPRRLDVPVNAGLHHHGKNPEAPGYTLDELLRLCRVQAMNQRVLALKTLANIVKLAKSGFYDEFLLPISLMRSLVESSICTIIRYALDETAESIVVAACRLLGAFLHSELDETCLDISYALSLDTSQLKLAPLETDGECTRSRDDDDAEMEEDEAICKKDMILGLLRMGTLQRLRYIMEVLQPRSGQCICNIFSILVRISRHSAEKCHEVFNCPRLMDVITEQFLPTAWQSKGFRPAFYPSYGFPFWGAVKLCRIIASISKDLATTLVEKYNIGVVMIRYIMTEPGDMMIPLEDACQLIVESYRLWSQLLACSLCGEYFCDLFETMITHIRASVSLQPENSARQFQWDRAAALSLVIGNFAALGKTRDDMAGFKVHLTGIIDVAVMALGKLLQNPVIDANISYYYLIASLAHCCTEAVACNSVEWDRNQLKIIVKNLVPQFQSGFGDRFAKNCARPPQANVHLLDRDPACLPTLESVGGGGLIEMIRDGSLYPLFTALRRLCSVVDDRLCSVTVPEQL